MPYPWQIWALNGLVATVALVAFLTMKSLPVEAVGGFLAGYAYTVLCARIYFGRWLGD